MLKQIEFNCPECRGDVKKNGGYLKCEKCNSSWEDKDGIPNFSRHNFYWNRIPRERMGRINEYASKNGWERALDDLLLENENYIRTYVTERARADWISLIPSPVGRALDIGCNMGGVSVPLAHSCETLVAADSTYETLEFLKIRKEQEGLSNIYPVRIDPLDFGQLPFPDSYFDLVVLNGVLEWIGTQRDDADPRQIQVDALKEIKRVLKPDGHLYIGIENRYSYSYFMGSSDHSGLPFTSILPRKLANLYTKLATKSGYRTLTYSYWGYRDLLKNAGFTDARFFLSIPSYRHPIGILPVDDRELIHDFIRYKFNYKKLLKYLWIFLLTLHIEKVFSNSFSIIVKAEKNNDEKYAV